MNDQSEPILQFFTYQHLPPHLQAVSRLFEIVAQQVVTNLPRNPERTVALRKLLEAKDAAVRAMVMTDYQGQRLDIIPPKHPRGT